MRIIITKAKGVERIEAIRRDGSTVSSSIPSKWWIPHDSVHVAVEQALGLRRAFWGLIAAGHHPDEIAAMARDAGHASAKRSSIPAAHFVEAIQAERIVEAFEADQWNGGSGDPDGIRDMANSGCEQSKVDPLAMTDQQIEEVRARLAAIGEEWSRLNLGESIEFTWAQA